MGSAPASRNSSGSAIWRKAGGLTSGGFNFDAKLRRQSIDRADLFHAHIGGIDTLARALLVAADLVTAGDLQRELVDNGHRVRVYVPFGSAWYPYLTRRMAERPANLLFFLRALVGR